MISAHKEEKTIYISAKSALHKVKGNFPFNWDLNIYRGCEHGCVYCYALYSHQYLGEKDFYRNIYVKENIVEVLERELKKKTWHRAIINLGGITDSYQPIEQKEQLMPEILRLLIKYQNPLIISTKSTLILRDFDLLSQLAEVTHVNIAATITTPDERIRKQIEPMAAPSTKRFDVLRAFSKTNASLGLHIMPIIPYLTDKRKDLETLFQQAAQVDVNYVLSGRLYLRGKTRPRFVRFMRNIYPGSFKAFMTVFNNKSASAAYNKQLYGKIVGLKRQYGLTKPYQKPEGTHQLKLF